MDLLRIARHPNNLFFALCISIIAHFTLLYVLGVLPFSQKPLQGESILVDFTLVDGKGGGEGLFSRLGASGNTAAGEPPFFLTAPEKKFFFSFFFFLKKFNK